MHEIATVSSLLTSCDFYVPEDSFTKSEAEYLLQEIEQLYMLAFEPYRGLGPGGGPRFSYGTPKERRKGTVAALHVNKRNRPPSGWLLVRCGVLFGAALPPFARLLTWCDCMPSELSLFAGLCVALLALIAYHLTRPTSAETAGHMGPLGPYIVMWRLTGCCVLFAWAWLLNVTVYTKVRINYALIFELDPRETHRPESMLESCCLFTGLWLSAFAFWLLSIKGVFGFDLLADRLPWYPIGLFLFCIGISVALQILSRGWLLKVLWNIVRAPFVPVRFKDFYMADQLTTMSIVLVDLHITSCFLFRGVFSNSAMSDDTTCVAQNKYSRPLLALIPSVLRFLQCLRRYRDSCPPSDGRTWCAWLNRFRGGDRVQLWNAGKYACAFPIVAFSYRNEDDTALQVCWWISMVIGAGYKYYWDIVHDWGLTDHCHFSNGFLRAQKKDRKGKPRSNTANHLYPIPFYYVAAFLNLGLRVTWAFTISPDRMHPDAFGTIIAVLEVLRRGQWNLLRLENEHLNNCDKFRAVSARQSASKLQGYLHHDEHLFPSAEKAKDTLRRASVRVDRANIHADRSEAEGLGRDGVTIGQHGHLRQPECSLV